MELNPLNDPVQVPDAADEDRKRDLTRRSTSSTITRPNCHALTTGGTIGGVNRHCRAPLARTRQLTPEALFCERGYRMHISAKGLALSAGLSGALLLVGTNALAASVPSTLTLETHHPSMRQVLRPGSTGHWVMTLQADLALLGYSQEVGPVDGIFGPKTQAGLKAFQIKHGFPSTGITSPAVWQDILAGLGLMPALKHTSANTKALEAVHPAMRQVLHAGSTGHWVMTLQADLALLGYKPGPMTGYFGGGTVAALRRFEVKNGFAPTGITSPAVWQDILAAFGLVAPVRVNHRKTTMPTTTQFTTPTTGSGSIQSGPVLPATFPTGGPPTPEPSLPNASAGIKGQFPPSVKTIDGRPVLKAFHMVATSYAPTLVDNYPYGPVDAFGTPLENGMVAVDPRVIPLGSVVYVTGYHDNYLPAKGFLGKAMDTGGAIKGDRVDIFINASEQVVSDFGVQQVTVYQLGS